MKSKKTTLLVTAMSISLVLSTQTSMASELGNKMDSADNVQEQDQVQIPGKLQSNEQNQNDVTQEQPLEQQTHDIEIQNQQKPISQVRSGNEGGEPVDTMTSATYYNKANWENKIKDKSRWKVEDSQRLVRVSGSDPVEMNDIDYDGMFIDANGRYVIRLVYKEKTQVPSAVWHRALINFGDLDKYIDYDLSYILGKDGKTQYKFDPVEGIVGRGFDLRKAVGDRTNNRKNLPINLVLKDGVDLNTLGQENYIVQMRLTDDNYERVYSYAPKGTSMDYSTYTKTTAVDLGDKLGTLFIKGGKQKDLNNATNQQFFMSEFIANPEQYNDKSNLGIIRTQYMGQTATIVRETVGGQPMAFTQVFDANLVNYMKADEAGNIAYVNVMTDGRVLSPYTKNIGIPKDKINYTEDGKLAYIVIGTEAFQKDGVQVVTIPQHDQYTMLSGFYITAIDYVVDKSKFEDTFSSDKVRKLNYTTMSGWTNPNTDGWTIYEKEYANDYVVPEGESYLIDTGEAPTGGQIMIQVGGEQAILRKAQGYYNGYVSGDSATDVIEEYAKGVYQFTLREGATILKGKKLKIYMPYTPSHDKPVNFLEIHNGTKLNEGGATLKLQKDRNINMHLYKEGKKGYYILKYTLKGGTEASKKFEPKILWQFDNKDKVMAPGTNAATVSTGGNFYIDTTKLEPGADIIVESYDEKGNKIDSETSYFKYVPLEKSQDNVKLLTWTDHSDKKSVLSINKSLYTPYHLIFTNDYVEGNPYINPKELPADDSKFNDDTKKIIGFTRYDGGKIRFLYEEGHEGKLIAKVEAGSNDYDNEGNIKGEDVRKDVKINKSNIFDPQFAEDSKVYKAYQYTIDLEKMLPYHSDNKEVQRLELLKDMKFVANASDGSSLPSDLFEARVRARVLFDATEGQFADSSKKVVKIVPDNLKFYGESGYTANGFEGDNVEANTGDKFPDVPKATGNKNFLGWVTADGKKALGDKTTVSAEEFNKLTKDQIFFADTPVTKHLVVYAIYSEETIVTFDANGGKFADDKEQNTVKVDAGKVTAPANPTKEGYTFKGWAATKDATEADPSILTGVTASKSVYAVWEKNAEDPLKVKAPEKPVEVKDLKSVTTDEKDKIKEAVIKANPKLNLTKDDITVSDEGDVTVKKDGKSGTIEKDKTVTQKLVENNFNPPEKPVPVDKIGALTPEEVKAVKEAVKAANPDRNFKDEEITVENDGTVKINQGGKVGTIPADKTVVQKDTMLDLNPPKKTEVKDITNLTKEERDKVAAAVKKANKGKLSADAVVTVDNKGDVTVIDGTKTGNLEGKDTVKPFDRAGKTLNDPAITKVANPAKLTEDEKTKVRDAVKKANPDLDFKDEEIKVADDGTVTVPMGTDGDKTIEPAKTVKKAEDADNMINLVAPEKTEVADKTNLTQEEKNKVIAAVKKANKGIPKDATITVGNDGSVTVTQGTGDNQKVGQLSQADTVYEKIKAPKAPVEVNNPSNLTDDEKAAVKKAVEDANKDGSGNSTLPADATIDVADDGTVTVKDKDGKEIGKLKPEQTVKKAGELKDPAKVAVKDPANLTPEEKQAIKDAVKKANPDLTDDQIKVNDDGSVTVTKPGEKPKTIGKDKTISTDVKTPTPTEVADKKNLTDDEKAAVKKAVEDANKDGSGKSTLPEGATITVGKDGTVTVKDKDGKETIIPSSDTVKEKATPGAESGIKAPATPITVPNAKALTDEEKAKVKTAVEEANKDADGNSTLPEGATIEVADDGTVIVKDKAGKEIGKITPDKTVKQDESKLGVKAPEAVEVSDPENVTLEEQAKIKEAVKKANPDLNLTDDDITVDDKGNVTVTKDGKSATLTPDKTVKKAGAIAAPAKPVEVKDPSKLTADEKKAVEDAVRKANKNLPADAKVTVGDDGTVTVTDKDGKEIGKLTPDKTVKKAGDGSQANANNSNSSNHNGNKSVNTGDESTTGILATFIASITALFTLNRRKKDEK